LFRHALTHKDGGDEMFNNRQVYTLLGEITQMFVDKQQELSRYDAVIGDGDHGFSIARGCQAGFLAVSSLEKESSIQDYFKIYGRELTNEVGGAMGPLFGLLFTEIGKSCANKDWIGLDELAIGLKSALEYISELGGAKVGDKTMVDAITPTVHSLMGSLKAHEDLVNALEKAVKAAKEGVKSTIPLRARMGRSKYLKERSIGYQDAGATSFYYLLNTIWNYAAKENAL